MGEKQGMSFTPRSGDTHVIGEGGEAVNVDAQARVATDIGGGAGELGEDIVSDPPHGSVLAPPPRPSRATPPTRPSR